MKARAQIKCRCRSNLVSSNLCLLDYLPACLHTLVAATTQYGGGIHEPVKHERAFLLEFLEAVAEDNAEAASEVPEQQVYAAASFRSAEAPTHFGATCQADLPAWIPAMRTLETLYRRWA